MIWKRLSWFLILALALGFAAGCSDDDDNGTTPPPAVDQFETVRAAVDNYLTGLGTAPTISAQNTFENLSSYYVLSTRSAAHYALGHVPGADNIPYVKVADAATNRSAIPTTGTVVVYCYTGHTGGVAATVLGVMGYPAKNMKYGMCAWTDDSDVRATTPFREEDVPEIETTPHTLTVDYGLPTLDVTTSTSPAEIIRAACDAYLNKFDGTGISPVMAATALHTENFEDGDTTDNYFVLSARSAAHYNLGHITGAYNIPWNQVAKVENLRKLPRDKKIVVYCYTGHTGAIAATALGVLGYDAVNLKHGMCGWTKDAAIRATSPFSEENDCKKYEYETGAGK